MQIRKFVVGNVRDAIHQVKGQMGPEAVIMSIRTIKGRNGPTRLEVTAGLEASGEKSLTARPRAVEDERPPVEFEGGLDTGREELPAVLAKLQMISTRLNDIEGRLPTDELSLRLEDFAAGLSQLQKLVIEANGGSHRRPIAFESDLGPLYEKLVAKGVEEAFAQDLIEQTSRRLSARSLSPALYGFEYLAGTLIDQVRTAAPFAPGREQHIHMFVGPTGVGKTTTIAKLAAQQVFESGRKVALLTVDTFRIDAVDQLRTYARILNVPLEVCMSEVDLVEAARRHGGKDTLLIDTAGASQKDARMMGELAKVYQAGVPMDVHLIVSATTNATDLQDIASRYGVFPLSSLIVSKLDEANNFGNLYNLMQHTNLPCSFFTVGQNVPEDIEVATAERVADLLLDVVANA